ncbi:hypothetical protein DER44DRAFT_742119 [Fusarium oxysporum]|nr:hypothetical protein DER44DRAFT_742119 [Fusarium oxysporum]
MAPDKAQPHKRKSGEANTERELDRTHDSRHLDRNRNHSGPDSEDYLTTGGQAGRNELHIDDMSGAPSCTVSGSIVMRRASEQDSMLPSLDPDMKCAGCGSSTHRLNICMKASPSGLMSGCPLCNTLEPNLADCPKTKDDVAIQLEIIQMRANMPPFQQTREWVAVLRAAVANGHTPPNGFPWTVQFTRTLHDILPHYQEGLDRVGFNNREGLPIDPDTKDWETVQRNVSTKRDKFPS